MNNAQMAFPAHLRRLRQAAGLSQEQLAHAIGRAGQSAIANYEAGKREPTVSELPSLARALGVQVAALFSELEPASQPVQLDISKLTGLIETVEAAVEQSGRPLPPRTKARVLASLYINDQARDAASPESVKVLLASLLDALE